MNLFSAVVAITFGSWVIVPGGAWSPSPKQLNEVRSKIEPFVKQQAIEQRLKLVSWSQYSFQYQGQLEDGKKIIFVNAFCEPPPPQYPQQEFFSALDGGPCYFRVKYDPQTKNFFHLSFNGVA